MPQVIGIDFDNTIVSYDGVFWRIGRELGLIPAEVGTSKNDVRDYLRGQGREDDWTELQGVAYGPRIGEATIFPGVLEFLSGCQKAGMRTVIISHKTRAPYRGSSYDLHTSATDWLRSQGISGPPRPLVDPVDTFFETTKAAKLARIAEQGCTHFVDDLPEFLAEPEFPSGVTRLLFDPTGSHRQSEDTVTVASWAAVSEYFGLRPGAR